MQVPELPSGFYRIIVFMQNLSTRKKVSFEPVIYSFGFRLFSFVQRSSTKITQIRVEGEDFDQIEVEKVVKVRMPFSSFSKLDCYSRGRRLPRSLSQDVLL